MKFQIEIAEQGVSERRWESFDEEECHDEASIKEWAEATVKRFNDSLRPGERPREFCGGIKIIGEGARLHRWTKRNLTTQGDWRGVFDNVQCTVCGARARRYGIDTIKMQKSYTAKKWKTCPGAAI